MFLHSMVQDNLFDESLHNGEDTKFIYQILREGVNIVILHQNLYYYRQHEHSINKMYSIKAIQSMYTCERYICDQEKDAGRMQNAIIRERTILQRISEWYVESKHLHERALEKYLKELVEDEKQIEIYSYVGLKKKIQIFLVFYCYPIYRMAEFLKCKFRDYSKR